MHSRPRSLLHSVLFGRNDVRLRAIWRVLIPGAVFLATLIALETAGQAVPVDALGGQLLTAAFFVLATGAALTVSARWVDRRPLHEFGLRLRGAWWRDFLGGILLGVGLSGLMVLLHGALGWARVDSILSPAEGASSPVLTAVGVGALFWLGVAIWEEVLFRGVLIRNAVEGLGSRGLSPRTAVLGAWVVGSVVFGAVHYLAAINHESISVHMVVLGAVVSGGYFGLAYILTGSLALPIGLHMAMNFGDANLFGETAAPYDGHSALVRIQAEYPGAWEAVGGLRPVFLLVTLAAVLVWVRTTRGSLAPHASLLRAAEASGSPSAPSTGAPSSGPARAASNPEAQDPTAS